MELLESGLPGVVELRPARHGDDRGWFSEVWNRYTLAEHGIDIDWVQDNESVSAASGTLRGIHFQTAPHPQDKLVRVISGRILDVAVDLRRSSATFGQHVAVELTADAGNQLLVPQGFGHAFVTLEADCRVAYKVSGAYSPECDAGIRWDDPTIGIDWPMDAAALMLSDKDRSAPLLADADGLLFD